MQNFGNPPTGTVTFLFTDIEGSTKRWEQYPQQMQAALQRHDTLLKGAIENNGGYIFKTMGASPRTFLRPIRMETAYPMLHKLINQETRASQARLCQITMERCPPSAARLPTVLHWVIGTR